MLSGKRETGRMNAGTIVVLGNGPSLSSVDFPRLDGVATIGLNAAYRHWQSIDWRPTYYACLDEVVGLSHADEIANLIDEGEIQGFLLRDNLINVLGDRCAEARIINFDTLRARDLLFFDVPTTTGSGAAIWGAYMGYSRIVLLGVDANYTELVPGAKRIGGLELEIQSEADNPNYYFQGYQAPGDKYQVPNPEPNLHIESWRIAGENIARFTNSEILNANSKSAVRHFPFTDLESTLGRPANEPQRALKQRVQSKTALPVSIVAPPGDQNSAEAMQKRLSQALTELRYRDEDMAKLQDAYRSLVHSHFQMRALSTGGARSRKEICRVNMSAFINGAGWYNAEPEGRWTGPSSEAYILLPDLDENASYVIITINSAMSEQMIRGLKIWFDEQPVELKLKRMNHGKGARALMQRVLRSVKKQLAFPLEVHARLPIPTKKTHVGHMLKFSLPFTVSPSQLGTTDDRQLGICVRTVAVFAE